MEKKKLWWLVGIGIGCVVTIVLVVLALSGNETDTFEGFESQMVNLHNYYRSEELPAEFRASNMQALRWDQQLAQEAKKLAQQCTYEHYTDGYGQNLYMDSGVQNVVDEELVKKSLDSWASERFEDFPIAQERYQMDGQLMGPLRHYSAMVWAGTNRVGCAVGFCNAGFQGGWDRFVVCNYAPAGNYHGQPWYEVGPPCSECSNTTKCNDQGLCVERAAFLLPFMNLLYPVNNSTL